MKILHAVQLYYPSAGGAQEVVRQLSERMVQAGHDVTVATTKIPGRPSLVHNGVKIVEFDISATSHFGAGIVTGIKGDIKQYQNFLRKEKFDVVMTYAAQQWTTDLMLPILDEIKAVKVFVPCGYSALYDPKYEDYFAKMPDYLRQFDATIYLSNDYRDTNFAREHGISNTHLIPNGADETEFNNPINPQIKLRLRNQYGIGGLTIMTIANYTSEKGHRELLYVYKRLPVSKATLISAGSFTPGIGDYDLFEKQATRINLSRKFLGKRVIMVDGQDRPLIRDLLKCADMFIFLSNIEASPLVLFEAAAAGVPFVATAAGNSAEIAAWTGGGLIVKTHQRDNGRVAADLKSALWQVTRLARDPERRQALGAAGHKAWQDKYTWQKITQQYLELYKNLLESKASKK